MHFSKTYAQLLSSLPPDLRDNAIQYRQLKKVINQIVVELSSLGLDPQVLHDLIEVSGSGSGSAGYAEVLKGKSLDVELGQGTSSGVVELGPQDGDHLTNVDATTSNGNGTVPSTTHHASSGSSTPLTPTPKGFYGSQRHLPKVVYEFNHAAEDSSRIEPRLRILMTVDEGRSGALGEEGLGEGELVKHWEALKAAREEIEGGSGTDSPGGRNSSLTEDSLPVNWLESLQRRLLDQEDGPLHTESMEDLPGATKEVIIPLRHDQEFYNILFDTLKTVSEHLNVVHEDFMHTLVELSRTIGDSSRPASTSSKFQPYSPVTMQAGSLRVKTDHLKSDLYFWREVFQLYIEAEVFESLSEVHHGERSLEESEKRLQLFADRVLKEGLGDSRRLKLKESKEALETFLSLNLFILNLKKLSFANSEATRKILKKHAKRTALRLPGLSGEYTPSSNSAPEPLLALVAHRGASSLPRTLVQAIGEVLLPVIPSLDDYACLICTSIAFKPIRLSCRHLFCVRCLVKMQKRGKGDCPMCRAPSVLIANRTNVDWALLNFMQDWFPIESKEKLKANEKEAAAEQMTELGLDPEERPCRIM